MSSLFKPQLDKFSSQVFKLPADEYELQIGSIKPRTVPIRNGEKAGTNMYMLSFSFKVISTTNGETEYANKLITIDFIVNPDESDGFNRVLKLAMAANGIIPGTEEGDNEFISRFGNDDWSVDFENNKIGGAWSGLAQKRVIAQVEIGGKAGYERNQFKGNPRPI